MRRLPGPNDDDVVFDEPWQAQAFAMAVELNAAGHFTWQEWADTLSEEIRRAQAGGDPGFGDTYYHWLAALERLVAEKGLIGAGELERRKDAWADAAAHTPHGKPIELSR